MRSTLLVCGLLAACGDSNPVRHLDGAQSIAMPGIYVTTQSNAVLVFALDAQGDVPPIRMIAGPSTGLSLPVALGVDHQGLIYVTNRTAGTVTAFAKDANGDVAPTRTLTGPNMLSPDGLAVDVTDEIYVSTCPTCGASAGGDTALYHFAAGANTSDYTIAGSNAGLTNPGITLDSDRNLIVPNAFGGAIETFAPGSMGNVAPVRSFTPTGVQNIQGAIAANGVIALVSPTDGIDLFDATATGTASPAGTIPFTGALSVMYPAGIVIDASTTPPLFYLNDYFGNAIYIGQLDGTGTQLSVSNVRVIQGATTMLSMPVGMVVIH